MDRSEIVSGLPRISVIIPVRNAADTLKKALDSLKSQQYTDLEVMVLDAASTDGTQAVIAGYGDFISYTRSYRDGGTAAAINEGIALARGDIIAILCADDWYEPGILREVAVIFAQNPSLDVVTTQASVWNMAENPPSMQKTFAGRSMEISPLGTPMPNARFFKRSIFQRYGLFQMQNHAGGTMIASDLEFLLRLSQYPINNYCLNKPGYHYGANPRSLTFSYNPANIRQMYLERMHIAEQYLRAGTLRQYAARLRRWHRRGSSRDFYWELALRNWKQAWQDLVQGIRFSGPLWILDTLRVGLTKGYKL